MILTVTAAPQTGADAVSLPAFRALANGAALAGVDAVLFLRAPAPAPAYDPLVVIAALAALKLPIGLGASIPIDVSEPFHIARAFAAIDRLTAGQSALIIDTDPQLAAACAHTRLPADRTARRRELLDVVGKLLDSWEDEALLVDRPNGLFTDPDRIHRINHNGPHYAVRGPLNAPRPPQGAPILVAPASCDPTLATAVADLILIDPADAATMRARIAACGRPPDAVRLLADIAPAESPVATAALMRDLFDRGGIDGCNLRLPALALGEVPALPERTPPSGGTLRQRLGLARLPSRFAA